MHWIYAHLIGDYLLQNDWMAKNKKTSSFVCLAHIVTYILPFTFCGFSWLQLFVIALQHFVQDRTSLVKWFLENTGKSEFASPPMAPWSIIIVDNIFHILTIATVASLKF